MLKRSYFKAVSLITILMVSIVTPPLCTAAWKFKSSMLLKRGDHFSRHYLIEYSNKNLVQGKKGTFSMCREATYWLEEEEQQQDLDNCWDNFGSGFCAIQCKYKADPITGSFARADAIGRTATSKLNERFIYGDP